MDTESCAFTVGWYRLRLVDRHTGITVWEPPMALVDGSFDRRLDATSVAEATVEVNAAGDTAEWEQCCAAMAYITEWNTELEWWREGDAEPSWVGPIVSTEANSSAVRFTAVDRSGWWSRRLITADTKWWGVDASEVFVETIDMSDAIDPCGLVAVAASSTGILIYRALSGFEYNRISDVQQDLGEAAMDWSVVGARLYIGAVSLEPFPPYPVIEDSHWWEPPTVIRDGRGVVSQVIVLGSNTVGIWPVTPETDPPHGVHQGRISDTNILGPAEAVARAKSLYEQYRSSIVTVTSESGLTKDSPLRMVDMVPGRCWQLRLPKTCLVVADSQTLRMNKLEVTIEGGQEKAVTPTFVPLGTVDLSALVTTA